MMLITRSRSSAPWPGEEPKDPDQDRASHLLPFAPYVDAFGSPLREGGHASQQIAQCVGVAVLQSAVPLVKALVNARGAEDPLRPTAEVAVVSHRCEVRLLEQLGSHLDPLLRRHLLVSEPSLGRVHVGHGDVLRVGEVRICTDQRQRDPMHIRMWIHSEWCDRHHDIRLSGLGGREGRCKVDEVGEEATVARVAPVLWAAARVEADQQARRCRLHGLVCAVRAHDLDNCTEQAHLDSAPREGVTPHR
eukprot:scaffold73990_cov74-Phaeocystis_antarctica.AAC.3